MNMKANIRKALVLGALASPVLVIAEGTAPVIPDTPDTFYDDFRSGKVDPARWFAANKNWGGKDKATGEDYNGGVVPENLYVRDGVLCCEAHGNQYEGEIAGIAKNGDVRPDGKRVGACAVTKDYFASGSYEICAKVAPSKGVCCTMWTFEYEELYKGDEGAPANLKDDEYFVVNHEIDIEMPGRPGSAHEDISYNYALCNTWVGENEGEYLASHMRLPEPQDDGEFHTYRFDWHTGDKDGTITPRVEFYFDGVPVVTNYTYIPYKAGRLWVGAWFPNGWAGTPDFDTDVFQVKYVKIIPFHEENDRPQHETYGSDGLVEPLNVIPPLSWKVGASEASSVKARLHDNGELVFSGKGEVKEYGSVDRAPWASKAGEIKSVVVSNGVELAAHTLDGLSGATFNGGPLSEFDPSKAKEFYDDFSSGAVDSTKWFAACSNWDSWHTYWSGGVVPENLYVRDGVLCCEAHGDLYTGDVVGYDEGGNPRKTRVGACAVTRDYYASGRYEVRAKVIPRLGASNAMWSRVSVGGKENKIELQFPGRPEESVGGAAYDYALCFNQTNDNKYTSTKSYVKLDQAQNDGEFHVYRYDWHTGGGSEKPYVDFYVDDVKIATNTGYVPTKAARFWVGAWFPKEWAGSPDFDTYVYEIDYVRITPFHEANDGPPDEERPYRGMGMPVAEIPPPLWYVGSEVASAVTARLDGNGGLVFSGSGEVAEFDPASDAPWAQDAGSVRSVVIRDGVTIAEKSISGLYNVSSVNGTALTRYLQVMTAAGKEVPSGTGPAQPADATVRVYRSSDLKTWSKVDSPLAVEGKTVTVPADAPQGFYKFVTE